MQILLEKCMPSTPNVSKSIWPRGRSDNQITQLNLLELKDCQIQKTHLR